MRSIDVKNFRLLSLEQINCGNNGLTSFIFIKSSFLSFHKRFSYMVHTQCILCYHTYL